MRPDRARPRCTMLPRLDFRLEAAEQFDQFRRAVADDGGERHAVNVARRRSSPAYSCRRARRATDSRSAFSPCESDSATPAATPAAMEWSPPSTSGRKPSVRVLSVHLRQVLGRSRQFPARYFARFSPIVLFFRLLHGKVADVFDGVAELLEARLAVRRTRSAEGPMSTPRRLWPRSIGTPMIRIFCGMLTAIRCAGQAVSGLGCRERPTACWLGGDRWNRED